MCKNIGLIVVKILLASFMLINFAIADAPIYKDEVLTLPESVIVLSDGDQYYSDIQFTPVEGDLWRLNSANRKNLVASIDSVEVLILESFPVQVHLNIAGNKSIPCVNLEKIVVSRMENTFHVLVAETSLGPAESCIAVLEPFTTSVILDVYGLKAGNYKVLVNGNESSFSLSVDNK